VGFLRVKYVKKALCIVAAVVVLWTVVAIANFGISLFRPVIGIVPPFDSVEELASSATDIVRVRVLNERVGGIHFRLDALPPGFDFHDLYFVHQLSVQEVFQGDVQPGDVIELAQWMRDYPHRFARNDEVVLFLREPGSGRGIHYSLLCFAQSVYRYPPSDDGVLEGLAPWLRLTREELRQISEGN